MIDIGLLYNQNQTGGDLLHLMCVILGIKLLDDDKGVGSFRKQTVPHKHFITDQRTQCVVCQIAKLPKS